MSKATLTRGLAPRARQEDRTERRARYTAFLELLRGRMISRCRSLTDVGRSRTRRSYTAQRVHPVVRRRGAFWALCPGIAVQMRSIMSRQEVTTEAHESWSLRPFTELLKRGERPGMSGDSVG